MYKSNSLFSKLSRKLSPLRETISNTYYQKKAQAIETAAVINLLYNEYPTHLERYRKLKLSRERVLEAAASIRTKGIKEYERADFKFIGILDSQNTGSPPQYRGQEKPGVMAPPPDLDDGVRPSWCSSPKQGE
jgi:hypothetical protein